MNKLIVLILPPILLAILYVLILTRKGELKRFKISLKSNDWLTFFAVIFAGNVLLSAARALSINLPQGLMLPATLLFVAILFFIALRRAKKGKPIVQRLGDERINLIYAKSARNALFVTYLGFFVHLLVTDTDALDAKWVAITLGGGLTVLLASIYVYYFRKD